MIQQAHVPFSKSDVCLLDDGVTRQWSAGDDYVAVKMNLRWHEDRPGRSACTTDPDGCAADRLCGAFKLRLQWLVAGGEPQARVQSVDFYFMPGLNLTTLQIVAYFLLKKLAGSVDKLFRSRNACCVSQLDEAAKNRYQERLLKRLAWMPENSHLCIHVMAEAKGVPLAHSL